MTILTVKDITRGAIIAQAEAHNGAFELEGNPYFAPNKVNMENLIITNRNYTCSYKGTCHWVDLKDEEGNIIQNVGWIYYDTMQGYDRIKDHVAFYPGNRRGTVLEKN